MGNSDVVGNTGVEPPKTVREKSLLFRRGGRDLGPIGPIGTDRDRTDRTDRDRDRDRPKERDRARAREREKKSGRISVVWG